MVSVGGVPTEAGNTWGVSSMRRLGTAFFGALLILGIVSSAATAEPRGNSAAAHACQQGGYKSLFGSSGGFSSVGECVSYAARGGAFVPRPGQFLIPAGETATLTDTVLGSCNALTYGYQVIGGAFVPIGSKEYGCTTVPQGDVTIGPFPTDVILEIVLVDETCGQSLESTGGHAVVTGSNPYDVDISDAGFFCQAPEGTPVPPFTVGNLSTTLTVG